MTTFTEKYGSCMKYSHEEIMSHAIEDLGYEELKACVPYSLEEIRKALAKGDEYLNTLPMSAWDTASGFRCVTTKYDQNYYPIWSKLTDLYKSHGLNAWSCSEGVSVLKTVARRWARED